MRQHRAPARGKSRMRRALGAAVFIVALAAIAAVSLPALLGYRAMILTGGSMSPAIEPGDAVLIRRPSVDELRPGQVVVYLPIGSTKPTTHRIVSLHQIKGELFLQTKGDANQTPDGNLSAADAVLGRVALRLPRGAMVIGLLLSPIARLLLIGLPVALLLGLEIRDFMRDRRFDATPIGVVPQLVRSD